MNEAYFLLHCPKCNHDMKYHTATPITESKKKRCVYCGFNMSVRKAMLKQVGMRG